MQMKEHEDMIITGFLKCLHDASNRVKYNLAKVSTSTFALLDFNACHN